MADEYVDKYQADLHKKIEGTKKYLNELRFTNYKILGDALEEIGYDTSSLGKKEHREKFINSLKSNIKDKLKEKGKIGDGVDDTELESLSQNLLGISYNTIEKIIRDNGSDASVDYFIGNIEQQRGDFEANHYRGIAQQYITDKEHVRPGLEYLSRIADFNMKDLDLVQFEKNPEYVHNLFHVYGKEKERFSLEQLQRYGIPSHLVKKQKNKDDKLSDLIKKAEKEKSKDEKKQAESKKAA